MATKTGWRLPDAATPAVSTTGLPYMSAGNQAGTTGAMYQNFNSETSIQDMRQKLLQGAYPGAAQQIAYGNQIEPQREQSLSQTIAMAQPGNAQASVAQFSNQAFQTAANQSRLNAVAQRQAGQGSGSVAGQQQGMINSAQNATNQYWQSLMSPQGQMSQQQQLQQLYAQAQQSPLLAQLLQGSGQQKQQQGSGSDPFSNALGSIVGDVGGAWLGKALGLAL